MELEFVRKDKYKRVYKKTKGMSKYTTETPELNLEEYQAKINKLILEDSPAIFANHSRRHARCIIRTFLSGARESVDILAGDFGNDFYQYPDIRASVLQAVDNGSKVRVISLGTQEKSRAFIRGLANEANDGSRKGSFLVKFARVRPGTQVKHYMIIDGKRYRLEDYHDEGSNTVRAEVCCNGKVKAATMTRAFNAVWSRLGAPLNT